MVNGPPELRANELSIADFQVRMTIYYIVKNVANEQYRFSVESYLYDQFDYMMQNVLVGKLQQQMIMAIENFNAPRLSSLEPSSFNL